jgi:hypothetical protein
VNEREYASTSDADFLLAGAGRASAPSDEGHLGCHDRHELHVGIERQACHVNDGIADMPHIDHRFGRLFAVCLLHAGGHARRKFGQRVADVDLTAGDVIFSAVKRDALGQSGDPVLGRGVGAESGRGAWAESDPLLMMRPPRGSWLFIIRKAS